MICQKLGSAETREEHCRSEYFYFLFLMDLTDENTNSNDVFNHIC